MGRTSLMMVIGFNVVFMMMGFRMSQYASDAYIKYSSYYQIEQAQYASQSATNIALSGIYITNLTSPGAVWVAPSGTVTLANGATFTVTLDSNKFATKDTMQLVVNAAYSGIKSQTVVDFARASFTTYAMFNVNENGIYWITGDTCKGSLHTQDYLYVSGTPYFKGAVTTGKGLKKQNTSDAPVFAGGYHSGVNQPLPTDLTALKGLGSLTGASGGKDYKNTAVTVGLVTTTPIQVNLEFYKTGQIAATVFYSIVTSSGGAHPTYTTVVTSIPTVYNNIAAMSPNGVVLVENMPVHVQGVLNGNVTVGSVGTGSSVWIDSSIVYGSPSGASPTGYVNPKLPDGSPNPACTSTLGIVADNDVMITDQLVDPITGTHTHVNNGVDINIDASIFSLTGGFGAENYNSRGVEGKLNLVGAIQAKDRNPVGNFSGGTLLNGYHKNYDYDSRLQDNPPAGYPQTTNFQVKNWYEQITQYPDIFSTFMGSH